MHREVSSVDTARAMGSGDLDVLATPRLIAWMEALTARQASGLLRAGQTSVGTSVRIRHRLPSRVGDAVEITADQAVVGDRGRLLFHVCARNTAGEVVAEGELERAIVDRERFLADVP